MVKGLLAAAIFLGQATASAAPLQAMALKDFKMTSVNNTLTELVYKGEKITVESVGTNHFKLNGKDVIFKNTDTLEAVYDKTQAAYKQSGQKSAALDAIFIPRAHAAPPLLFTLLFGGLLGAGLASAANKRQCQQDAAVIDGGSPSYDDPKDTPVVTQ